MRVATCRDNRSRRCPSKCPPTLPACSKAFRGGARRLPRCWPRAPDGIPPTYRPSRSACWIRRPMKPFRCARCTPALTSCRSRRCPVSGPISGAEMRCATSSRAGRSPKRSPQVAAAVATANGALLVALTEGVSALALRVGEGGVAPAELDRLLEGVFLDLVPVILDAGLDYLNATDAMLALLTDLDDDQRARLSVDLGADPLTAPLSRRSGPELWTMWSRPRQRSPDSAAACVRSPLTVRRFTITVRARRGSWPAAWPPGLPICDCSATAALLFGMRCGR